MGGVVSEGFDWRAEGAFWRRTPDSRVPLTGDGGFGRSLRLCLPLKCCVECLASDAVRVRTGLHKKKTANRKIRGFRPREAVAARETAVPQPLFLTRNLSLTDEARPAKKLHAQRVRDILRGAYRERV
jgi:hypothetical protein